MNNVQLLSRLELPFSPLPPAPLPKCYTGTFKTGRDGFKWANVQKLVKTALRIAANGRSCIVKFENCSLYEDSFLAWMQTD